MSSKVENNVQNTYVLTVPNTYEFYKIYDQKTFRITNYSLSTRYEWTLPGLNFCYYYYY